LKFTLLYVRETGSPSWVPMGTMKVKVVLDG
jgi:hypothetical protein